MTDDEFEQLFFRVVYAIERIADSLEDLADAVDDECKKKETGSEHTGSC